MNPNPQVDVYSLDLVAFEAKCQLVCDEMAWFPTWGGDFRSPLNIGETRALMAEIHRLRDIVDEFADHQRDCPLFGEDNRDPRMPFSSIVCTCGYDKAMGQ